MGDRQVKLQGFLGAFAVVDPVLCSGRHLRSNGARIGRLRLPDEAGRGLPRPCDAGHGERSRSQLLFKLAGTDTAVLEFWLGKFGCTRVFNGVLNTAGGQGRRGSTMERSGMGCSAWI